MKITPTVQELPERSVAYVSFIGDYRGKPDVFAGLFSKLAAWAGPIGLLNADTVMISAYNNDPGTTPPEELSLDACLVVPDAVEVGGEIQKKLLPGGKYVVASLELTGPEQYAEAWTVLVSWLKDNELEMDTTSRPWYEVYKNDPSTHPQGHHILDMCAAVN